MRRAKFMASRGSAFGSCAVCGTAGACKLTVRKSDGASFLFCMDCAGKANVEIVDHDMKAVAQKVGGQWPPETFV